MQGFEDIVKNGDTIKKFNGDSNNDEFEPFGNQERANSQVWGNTVVVADVKLQVTL